MMSVRLVVARFILLTCTALGCVAIASAPATAGDPDIPTGAKRSPLLNGATPFSQKLLLYEELGLRDVPNNPYDQRLPAPDTGVRLPAPAGCESSPNSDALDNFLRQPLSPAPSEHANATDQNPWRATVAYCEGLTLPKSPIEGRPPGQYFAHQRYDEFKPALYFQSATSGARVNRGMRDGAQLHQYAEGTEFGPGGLYYNITADPAGPRGTTNGVSPRLHPKLPVQHPNSLWTLDGTFPGKLLMARYGQPILFRHYNALPISKAANNGFGVREMSTHFHNGHSPGESDGYPGAYFFPGQYYDYRWPSILAGHKRINADATDPRASRPDGAGGIVKIPGNYRETLSTLWFHDHRSHHTSENTYKGMAAMVNLYGGIDRGREGLKCHYTDPTNVNLCFPSGTKLDWGNRDYDINLSIADKAWDATGQLYFNIFNTDGFLGDRMTVNWTWQPYLDVRPRRYRFRMLNASVARLFKIALVTSAGQRVAFHMIANDGNIMKHAVRFPNPESQELPLQSIGERFDIIVDFKGFLPGTKLYFVNLAEHEDGSKPEQYATLAAAFAGRSTDPAVGKFLELRVAAAAPDAIDRSMNPEEYVAGKKVMLDLPVFTSAELRTAKRRKFVFGTDNGTDEAPWTIKTDDGLGESEDLQNVSAVPKSGAVEVWTFKGGKGWTHPVHAHFTEGQILSRDGSPPPSWERFARKDMYNIGRLASGEMEVALRFEDFLGTYVQHCHNTTHEDKAMLLRFDVDNPDEPMLIRAPMPKWDGVDYYPSYIIND